MKKISKFTAITAITFLLGSTLSLAAEEASTPAINSNNEVKDLKVKGINKNESEGKKSVKAKNKNHHKKKEAAKSKKLKKSAKPKKVKKSKKSTHKKIANTEKNKMDKTKLVKDPQDQKEAAKPTSMRADDPYTADDQSESNSGLMSHEGTE